LRVTFKLYAMLAVHLPNEYRGHQRDGNELALDVPEGTTVEQVTRQFKLPEKLVHLVLVDGKYIAPQDRERRELKEGEVLAIWPPIAGG
jgi:sulfur carrier protein ThiS